jgi:hypothetical protein
MNIFAISKSAILTGILFVLSLNAQDTPPWSFSKTVSPDTIWLEGSNIQPETATVTLRGCRHVDSALLPMPLDVMLVLDNSGSMGGTDPIRHRDRCVPAKMAAIEFISNLGNHDRVGAMVFAHWGQPDPGFTGAFDTIAEFKTHTEYSAVASAIMDIILGNLACCSVCYRKCKKSCSTCRDFTYRW